MHVIYNFFVYKIHENDHYNLHKKRLDDRQLPQRIWQLELCHPNRVTLHEVTLMIELIYPMLLEQCKQL